MRCALVLFNNAALVGIFRIQVSGAPGSTVVPSHVSPANLAGILKTQIVVVGLQMWESRSDFQAWRLCQASCAGHSSCVYLWDERRAISLSFAENRPDHACHLVG